jgi:hypothetical protein
MLFVSIFLFLINWSIMAFMVGIVDWVIILFKAL